MEQYKMTDTEHVYSNGTEYVPIYRMKQWFEHCRDQQRLTIDAVPVVRCRECKHYEMGVCLKIYDVGAASRYAWQERKSDDFCSYGERKEGAD